MPENLTEDELLMTHTENHTQKSSRLLFSAKDLAFSNLGGTGI
jgi:hypothetical protein